MPRAVSSAFRNPWVAILAGWAVAVGGLGVSPDATWADLMTPAAVTQGLALFGMQILALNADRPWGEDAKK